MPSDSERQRFQREDRDHDPEQPVGRAGSDPYDVGVTTRDARTEDDGEVDAPRVVPGRPTFPIGTERSDDGAPTDVIDFEPRDATPPTTRP